MKGVFLYVVLAIAGVVPLVGQVVPAGSTNAPDLSFGVIQGTVIRAGTSEPIPDAHLSVVLTPQLARTLIDAVGRGATGIPREILQAARGTGARGATGPAPLTAISDSAGHFAMTVPEGAAVVRAECEGYFGPLVNGTSPAMVTETTAVAARQTTIVRLAMIPGGTINGRVTDASGKAIANAPVGVLRRGYRHGLPALDIIDGKTTDDRGTYRLFRLAPGEYFVVALQNRPPGGAVSAASGAMTREVPVTTFYPSAIDVTAAAAVVVRSADDLAGVDIQMRTTPTFTVSGRVASTLPAGSEIGAINNSVRSPVAQLTLLPRDPNVLPDLTGGPAVANADGSFEIGNVLPGSYDLIARLPASTGWGPQNGPERATNPWAFGRTTIEVRGANVDGVSILVHQGVDVKGRVTVDGSPVPANLRISLQPDDNSATYNNFFETISNYQPAIDQMGAFMFPLLPEARYRFQFAVGGTGPARGAPPPTSGAAAVAVATVALPAGAYVSDVQLSGVSVYDNGLIVGADPVSPLEVIVRTDAGSVEGTVSGTDQKPAVRMTVVLVPAAVRRQNPALYRVATSDGQGHFVLARVPPGSYKLFAWDSVLPGAYESPEFLQPYEPQGVAVTVAPGAKASADVRVIRR